MNLLEAIAAQANNPNANPLLRRLAQHTIATQTGRDFGDVPVVSGLAETATHPALAAAAQLGLLLEGAANVGKVGTGLMETAQNEFNPLVGMFPDAPGSRLIRQAASGYRNTDGNLYERGLAANETGAVGNEIAQGLVNQFYDPTNYLGVAGKALQGTKLGTILNLADEGLGAPAVAGGKGVARLDRALGGHGAQAVGSIMEAIARSSAARKAADEAAKVAARGEIDLPLAPTSKNLRGYLKDIGLPAPEYVRPEPSALAPEDFSIKRAAKQYEPGIPTQYPNVLNMVPREAIGAGEEAAAKDASTGLLDDIANLAAPDLPPATGTRAEMLARLTPDEIDTLVNTAYPDQAAQANAIKAYPDPRDLTEAALKRIQTSPGNNATLIRLAERAPQLAKKLAYLPEPEEAAPAAGKGLDTLRTFILGGDNGNLGAYPPLDPAFYQKRLGLDPQEVPGLLRQLVDEGTLGDLGGGELAIRPKAARDIGGDIAAGGGFGLLPVPGGLPQLERTLYGAAAGGAAGLAGGALAPADSVEERAKHAAIGGAAGLVGGGNVGAAAPQLRQVAQAAAKQVVADPATWGKRLEGRLLADPEILADGLTAVRRAQDEAGVAEGPRNFSEIWRTFVAQWKRQAVDTWKQFGQDALYRAAVNEGIAREQFGVGEQAARPFQRAVSRERATGAWSLDDPLNQLYLQIGHPEAIGLKRDIIGTDFIDAVTDVADQGAKRFGRLGSAVAGGLIGLGSGLKRVNPVSPIAGAIRGAADVEISTMLHHLISTANDGWREAMAHAGTTRRIAADGEAFLAQLAAKGVDVTPLQGRAGLFTADEVRNIAGKEAGDAWDELTNKAIREVGDRVAYLAGDFRDKLAKDAAGNPKYTGKITQGDRLLGTVEKGAGKIAPFARWQIRSTPVLMEAATRHPLATYHVVKEMERLGEEAKARGKRAYQAGYDISTETPLLGAAARARLGGKQGTLTVDPFGAVVPYGEAIGGGAEEAPDDQTAYQRVADILGKVGFGPSPLIQTVAYTTGQDYRAPGSLSRTAGLEQLGTLLPGVGDIDLPTGRTLLDAARKQIEPALSDAGIKTTGPASASDPVLRRYAELVFDKTGRPVGDRANLAYLDGTTPQAAALMRQAKQEEALQAAAGNALSLTSPVPSTAQGADAAAAQAARQPVIEAQKMVETLPPVQGALLQQRIDQYKQANPATRIYDGTNPRARAELLMAEWERSHALLAFFPELYDYQRQIAAESLGLIAPGTLARKQRAIDESGQATAVPGVANTLRIDPGAADRLRALNQVRR